MTDASGETPEILDLPIGLDATGMRREFDSLGEVEVPANRYWGAQTQRQPGSTSASATTACRRRSTTPTAT